VIPTPARCDAWTDDSSPSARYWGASQNPKNEEAGQQAQF